MTTHDLKIWPEFFRAVREGRKRFEWRKDDRGFAEGDQLRLREWNPQTETYSGEAVVMRVTYVLRGPAFGVPEGYAVLSLVSEAV